MKSRRFVTVIVSLAFSAPLVCGQLRAESFQGLGDLPGSEYRSSAWGVSADGMVVVGRSFTDRGIESFRWTQDGGMVPLAALPVGVTASEAYAVSADGTLVVGSVGSQPVRWTQDAGWVALGDSHRAARDVSANGAVIVGGPSGGRAGEAWRWTQDGGLVGLGDLPGGFFDSAAWGVSDDGAVIAGTGSSASGGEAFRWTQDGGMIGLGDLPGGNFGSAAIDVSADGAVIVGYGVTEAGATPMRWTEDDGMIALGVGGGQARGASADGSVIVGHMDNEAFIWDPDHGMRNLQDILTQAGVDLTGWDLTNALDVSPDGRTVVGSGTNPDGNQEAWRAVVPEPSSITLLGIAVLGFVAYARRARSRRT